jgi:putative lipoprotein
MLKKILLGITFSIAAASSQGSDAPSGESYQKPDNSLLKVISGYVTYRERIALPAGSNVIVVLEDQSRMDVPATEITRYTHTVDGGPPYRFRLVIDPSVVDDRMTYGLRARIENEGRLMFTSTEKIDPFAQPAGQPIEIMVSKVGG